jgi:hypothetical protein
MFILLEPGMEIKIGDTAYANEKWYPVDPFTTGKYCTDMHLPIRRKISTIEDLFDADPRKKPEDAGGREK